MIALDYFKELGWHIEYYKYKHTPEQITGIIASQVKSFVVI